MHEANTMKHFKRVAAMLQRAARIDLAYSIQFREQKTSFPFWRRLARSYHSKNFRKLENEGYAHLDCHGFPAYTTAADAISELRNIVHFQSATKYDWRVCDCSGGYIYLLGLKPAHFDAIRNLINVSEVFPWIAALPIETLINVRFNNRCFWCSSNKMAAGGFEMRKHTIIGNDSCVHARNFEDYEFIRHRIHGLTS